MAPKIRESATQVDLLNVGKDGISASGSVADKLLANNFNVNALRANNSLMYDEWKDIDKVVLKATKSRLVGVQRLLGAGLTYNIPNGLGKTVMTWQDQNDVTDAEVSMDALSKGRRDRPDYTQKYMPLPVIHKDFSFGIRELEASRNGTEPLDMTVAELAGRKVAEIVEQILFKGYDDFTYGGGTIYGLEDYTYVNTGDLSAAWDASGTTGANKVNDLITMKQALIDAGFYGPYGVFVPAAYETGLDEDYTSSYAKTQLERLKSIGNISSIDIVDKMTQSKVVMAQMTADVIRMILGLSVTVVEWDSEGGFRKNFKVITIMLPQPRSAQDNSCGIAVYSA